MAEEKEKTVSLPKKKGGWFQKIPREILLSPGGIFLIFFAVFIEVLDFIIPWPIVEEIVMIPLNIVFCASLMIIAKVSIKSMVIPFLIERIPVLSSFLPTFIIRIFF